jgi:hypothetical protein
MTASMNRRTVVYADPEAGEHIHAGLVFDRRMPRFVKNGGASGVWRVKLCVVRDSPVGMPIVVRMPENADAILLMDVARILRVGDIANPVKLAMEYNQRNHHG